MKIPKKLKKIFNEKEIEKLEEFLKMETYVFKGVVYEKMSLESFETLETFFENLELTSYPNFNVFMDYSGFLSIAWLSGKNVYDIEFQPYNQLKYFDHNNNIEKILSTKEISEIFSDLLV